MNRFLFEMMFFLNRLKGPYLVTACSMGGIYGIASTVHYLFPSESSETEFDRKVALHRISHLVLSMYPCLVQPSDLTRDAQPYHNASSL